MPRVLFLIIFSVSLLVAGCRQKPENKTLASWNEFVDDAKTSEAGFIQELSADMKDNGFSQTWSSSDFHADTETGEIRLKVTPPKSEPYEVGFEFELKDGEWTTSRGFLYRDQRSAVKD